MKKYEDNWYLLIKTDKKKKNSIKPTRLTTNAGISQFVLLFESFKKRQTSKTSATKIFLKGANKLFSFLQY